MFIPKNATRQPEAPPVVPRGGTHIQQVVLDAYALSMSNAWQLGAPEDIERAEGFGSYILSRYGVDAHRALLVEAARLYRKAVQS